MTVLNKVSLVHIIIIIIIIDTTAPFEPRPYSEASASCPYSLQHSSNFSPSTFWHLPSHHLPIFCNDFDLYEDKTFHEPILRSLNRLIGRHILDSLAFFFGFRNNIFSGAGCQPYVQPPAILEDRLDCFLVWVFVTDQSGMGGPTSSYTTTRIAQ